MDWRQVTGERLTRMQGGRLLLPGGRERMIPADLQAVLALPGFQAVRWLDLSDQSGLGDAGMAVLAVSSQLAHLEVLVLPGCQIGDLGLTTLAGAPGFRGVRELDLGATARLRTDPHPPAGHASASLWLDPIGDAALAALAALPAQAALATVRFAHPAASPAGWLHFFGSPVAARLRVVTLEGVRLGPDALARVGSIPLTDLTLAQCRLRGEGVRGLLGGSSLTTLRSLAICLDSLGEDGARALSHTAALARLDSLDLYGAGLGDAGAGRLAAATGLGSLTTLNLTSNNIGPAGARALAARTGLPALRQLGLGDNALGTGEIETYWDGGSQVGQGEVALSLPAIGQQYFPGQPLAIFERKR